MVRAQLLSGLANPRAGGVGFLGCAEGGCGRKPGETAFVIWEVVPLLAGSRSYPSWYVMLSIIIGGIDAVHGGWKQVYESEWQGGKREWEEEEVLDSESAWSVEGGEESSIRQALFLES